MAVSSAADSAKHFGVLSSDDTFRLFCLDDLQLAEQTFHLELRERGQASHSQASILCLHAADVLKLCQFLWKPNWVPLSASAAALQTAWLISA